MLYDGSRVGNVGAAWFDPQHWAARGEIEGTARGRGSAHYVKAGRKFVLRHYHRGGLVALLSVTDTSGEVSRRPGLSRSGN